MALWLAVLLALSGLTLGWRYYERQTWLMPQAGGEYSEGVVGNPRTANPLLATTDADLDLAYLTHRGLFRTDEQGNLVTDLAQNWSLSDDRKTYLITLQTGLRWSDGQPLTATDVVFTFQSTTQPGLASPLAASFRDVAVVAAEDGLTASFTLKEPYVPFLSALTVGLIPQHVWQNVPLDRWSEAEANLKPIGSGPWQFSSLTHDGQGNVRSYVLETNPNWIGQMPYFKQFTLRFYPDTTSALEALRQSTIEGLGELTRRDKASLNPRRFVVYDVTLPQYTAVFYNQNASPVLKNTLIRQGLSYAINRPALIQAALSGQAQPATGPFTFGEVKDRTAPQAITYDPTKTVQLFEQAGFSRSGQNVPFNKDGIPLEITLTTVDYEEQLRVAEEVKRQWEAVGVVVSLELVAASDLQANTITPRNYQALLMSEVVGLDPDPYPFWHSSQATAPGLNLAQFKNHEADQLLVGARQNADPNSRLDAYVRFQNILQEESPATFLYSSSYSYAQSYATKGFSRTVLGQPAERLWDAGNWYERTSRNRSPE